MKISEDVIHLLSQPHSITSKYKRVLSTLLFCTFLMVLLEPFQIIQDMLFLVIISFILVTCTVDEAVFLSGEIGYWSLLGL